MKVNWKLPGVRSIIIESLLSHKINNHISYVTTLKEGIYINYRENQDKNYKTRLCLKIKRSAQWQTEGLSIPSIIIVDLTIQ